MGSPNEYTAHSHNRSHPSSQDVDLKSTALVFFCAAERQQTSLLSLLLLILKRETKGWEIQAAAIAAILGATPEEL
jgi:hypothetical protein